MPPMPTTRGALAAVAVGQKIYVNGGAGIPQGMQLPDGLVGGGLVDLYSTLEVFDTDTNTWTKLAPMPTPRNHHSIAYVDGKLYAIGGRVGSCYSGGWSSNVWMNEAYDIATNTWATRAPMPTARSAGGRATAPPKNITTPRRFMLRTAFLSVLGVLSRPPLSPAALQAETQPERSIMRRTRTEKNATPAMLTHQPRRSCTACSFM